MARAGTGSLRRLPLRRGAGRLSRTWRGAALWAPLLLFLAACAASPETEEALRDDGPLTRIAFGSCLDQTRPQPIAEAVAAFEPELFVFLGDNVYGDVEHAKIDNLVQAYDQQAAAPGFARIGETPRVLAIWDDHDFGVNDGGANFALKREAEDLFLEFWKVPANDPRRDREGLYGSYSFGPQGRRVQVILVDTRYFRSPLRRTDVPGAKGYMPDESPDKTLLGEAQWRWLQETLKQPADLRILASSIQVIAEGHRNERWGNLPRERDRLYRLLADADDTPILVISGDRHMAALYRYPLAGGKVIWEATSSSLNRPWTRANEEGPHQIGAVYGHENFGTIEIDWPARRVLVAIRDMDGKSIRQQALLFGQ